MEIHAHSMSAQVSHHTITMAVSQSCYSISYVTYEHVGVGTNLLALLQAVPCHIHQALTLGCGVSDDKHAAGIGIVSVQNGGAVHVYDVSFRQDVIFGRYSMTNDIVDAGTATVGESLVMKWCGDASMLSGEIVYQLVYL